MYSKKLNYIQEKFVDAFIFISYFFIFISFLGISEYAPQYLKEMEYYFRIYVCLFLIWRFNPLRKTTTFTELDRKLAFNAGMFIVTTTALNKYLIDAQDKAKTVFMRFK
jgi:hypothetical protein